MNTLRLILENLRQGRVSFKLPHAHECTSNQYRGLVRNNPDKCVGCGSCAYPCPTAAIVVTRNGDNYSWVYDPGKCTFCGRCIDRCKPKSLTMESKLPPLYAQQGELQEELQMVRKRPARPAAPAAKPVEQPAPEPAS